MVQRFVIPSVRTIPYWSIKKEAVAKILQNPIDILQKICYNAIATNQTRPAAATVGEMENTP